MARNPFFAVGLALALLAAGVVWAAPPSVSSITPRGAQRGGAAEFTFHGRALSNPVSLLFYEPGISVESLEAPDDGNLKAKVNIAADAAVGLHAARVVTSQGVSNLRLFSVGNLPEITETEPNNDLESAMAVSLDSTVNGVITSEDVDYFAVELEEGARLAVEAEALRFGVSLFDPKVRLFDPDGLEIVTVDDTPLVRQDAAFVHVAKKAGRHAVAISEASYGGDGDSHYRLHIGKFPRPLSVTPLGGAPGVETAVTWLGDPALGQQTITVPEGMAGTIQLAAVSDSGVSPSPVYFRAIPHPGVLEAEPNNTPEQATPGQGPGAFDGVIGEPGDVDWFQFQGANGQSLDVRVWARALGSPLDSVLTVIKADGGQLAADDDGAGIDSVTRVTLPEDGVFRLSVRDHLARGGPAFAYRIEVTPVEPKLTLNLIENPAVAVSVPKGNQVLMRVNASRSDFDGELRIEGAELPEGVTLVNSNLPAGVSLLPVVVTAAADAPVGGTLARLVGTLVSEEQRVSGELNTDIVLIEIQNRTPFYTYNTDKLAVAVTEPAPFNVEIVPPKAMLPHGGSIDLKVVAKRAEGFTAPIELSMPWTPNGIKCGTGTIPEGGSEAALSLSADGGAAVGPNPLVVVASGGGFTVCTSFAPVEVTPPWVSFQVAEVETEQGKPVELTVNLTHSREYEGAYTATLLSLPKGVTTAPLEYTHETTQLVFPLEVAADAPPGKHGGIFVQSVLQKEGERMVHNSGGGRVTVYEPLPPAVQEEAKAAPAPAVEAAPEKPKTRFPGT